MKRLLLNLLLLAAAAVPARASLAVFVTEAPTWMDIGQSVEWTVGVVNSSADPVTGFQLNVAFSEWLVPDSIIEMGHFASNGVFFFEGLVAPDSITFISDALAGGDVLPSGVQPLVRITFTAGQSGAPQLELFDPLFTLDDASDATISSFIYTEAVVTGGHAPPPPPPAPVPEPSTLALAGSALGAVFLARRRGGRL